MAGSRGQRVLNKVPHLHQISPQSRNKGPDRAFRAVCPPGTNSAEPSERSPPTQPARSPPWNAEPGPLIAEGHFILRRNAFIDESTMDKSVMPQT